MGTLLKVFVSCIQTVKLFALLPRLFGLMRTQIGVITATWSLTIRVIHLILLYFVILTIFLITPEMYLKCLARTSFMIMYTGMMIMILKMQLIYIEYTSIISYGNMLQMVMKTT